MPMLLLVHPGLPVQSVRELIDLAKKKPGGLNYASSGGGASHHLAMELLKQRAGIDVVLVTYKGGGAQLADQLSGRVELAFNLAVGVMPHVKEGRLRAIAVSSKERFPALPSVPTVDESGLKGFDASSWQGLSMPANAPRAIVQRVSADAAHVLKAPEVQAKILAMGGIAVGSSPEEFEETLEGYAVMAGTIGERLGQMHTLLAAPTDDADFQSRAASQTDADKRAEQVLALLDRAEKNLRATLDKLEEPSHACAEWFFEHHERLAKRVAEMAQAEVGAPSR